jgi:hypothetical protein
VESFRIGKFKKSQAIYKISQILAAEPAGDEQLKSDSLDRYVSTLDGIEALAVQLNEHGMRLANPILGKRKNGSNGGSQRHETPNRSNSRDSHGVNVDEFLEGISKENELDLGRDEPGDGPGDDDPGSGSDSDQGSDDGSEGRGRSNKKQRIYESQMPWFSKERQIRKSNSNPSCNNTRVVLDSGYVIPGRYTGRVPPGMGLGLILVTRPKPLPLCTRNPYTHGGFA